MNSCEVSSFYVCVCLRMSVGFVYTDTCNALTIAVHVWECVLRGSWVILRERSSSKKLKIDTHPPPGEKKRSVNCLERVRKHWGTSFLLHWVFFCFSCTLYYCRIKLKACLIIGLSRYLLQPNFFLCPVSVSQYWLKCKVIKRCQDQTWAPYVYVTTISIIMIHNFYFNQFTDNEGQIWTHSTLRFGVSSLGFLQ